MSEAFARAVAAGLTTRWLGRAHRHHPRTGSTNDDAIAWAAEAGDLGAGHGALVTADTQDAGRGRFGRTWHSPADAHVYASVVLRPEVADGRWAGLGLAVGVALRAGLSRWCSEIGLKWPNDLVIGERKLAGILCEARWIGAAPQIVVGFGINVRAAGWPEALRARAVTLEELGGDGIERAAVLVAVLEALEPVLDGFARDGFAAVRERYEAACVSLGRLVQVSLGDRGEAREVFAQAIDHDGALLVREGLGGGVRRVDAGELLGSG